MKYLIGEIGFSILIAGLIGLFFGWLLSRFLRSRSLAESRQVMISDIRKRDQEIDRLRYELRGYRDRGYRGENSVSEVSTAGYRSDSRQEYQDGAGSAPRDGYKVRTLKTQGTTAVLRVRPDQENFARTGSISSGSKAAASRAELETATKADSKLRADRPVRSESSRSGSAALATADERGVGERTVKDLSLIHI